MQQWMKGRVVVFGLSLLFALFARTAPAQVLQAFDKELILLAETARKSCVKIDIVRQIQTSDLQFLPEDALEGKGEVEMHSALSGILLNDEGHVATLGEALQGATRVWASVYDGVKLRRFKAEVIGFNLESNVGLIRIRNWKGGDAQPIGDSERVKPGALVMGLGFTFNLGPAPSHSIGIISATDRSFNFFPSDEKKVVRKLFQTSLTIQPGETGGPVFNMSGEVVALLLTPYQSSLPLFGARAALKYSTSCTLAVPINRIKEEVGWILAKHEEDAGVSKDAESRPWIGFTADEITDEALREQLKLPDGGVLISYIFPDDPASRAGILENDVLKLWNNTLVKGIDHLKELMGQSRVGDRVDLVLLRKGEELEVEVSLGEY